MEVIILNLKKLATNYIKLILLLFCIFFADSNYLYGQSKEPSNPNTNKEFNFINQSYWEINLLPIFNQMPAIDNGDDIYGARISITNFFYNYNNIIELGLDASLAYLKTSKDKDEQNFSRSISIFSPALIARWYPTNSGDIIPFLTAGIGPSYISNSNFEGRDLGNNFAFQDIVGIGVKSNGNNQFIAGIYIIHYSNASLHSDNRGITIPFSFQVGHRF